MPDQITTLLDSRATASKLPPAVMFVEAATGPNTAKVRDELGRERYTIVHPHWYDTVTSKYVKAIPTVAAAAPGDGADYKTIGAMDKYGFAQADWIVGIKLRSTGKQLLSKPYALTRHNGAHTNAAITKGIYEYARAADAFGQEEGKAAKWGGIFQTVDIRAEVSEGGALAIQHTWHKEACDESEWYGVIWEVDCLAAEYLTLIQPDGPHDTRLQPYVTEDKRQCIVEYFPESQFREGTAEGVWTGRYVDITHDYTTISGNLGAALELTADTTYYLTALGNLGAYNVTSSSTLGHEWVVKTNAAYGFRVNSTGTWNVSYGKFTSQNDNSVGEAIAGSSGSPAAGDQTVAYLLASGTSATSMNTSHATFNYCTCAAAIGVTGWSANGATRTISYTDVVIDNVSVTGATGHVIGANLASNGAVVLDNVRLGSNVAAVDGVLSYAIRMRTLSDTCVIKNCHFAPATTYDFNGIIIITTTASGTSTTTITNNTVTGYAQNAVLYLFNDRTGATGTVTVKHNLIKGVTDCDAGIAVTTAADATVSLTAAVINNIIMDCDYAGNYGLNATQGAGSTLSVTHTYNDYYNNTTNAYEALDATEITTDPALGNLPTGCVIDTATCNRPDGYAVLGFSLNGSDTFDNLSIDESIYTGTGQRYSGTQKVTMGPMYALSKFPSVGGDHAVGRGVGRGIMRGVG